MKCPVDFQKAKIDLCMYAAQSDVEHWIQCKGHRCMGVLDAKGKWRCFVTGLELVNAVEVRRD
jgi:hypothetical protein